MSHGGLTRARSWKRRIQPKEAYSSPGLLYSENNHQEPDTNDDNEVKCVEDHDSPLPSCITPDIKNGISTYC